MMIATSVIDVHNDIISVATGQKSNFQHDEIAVDFI